MPDSDTVNFIVPFYQRDTAEIPQVEHEVNLGIPLDSIFPVVEPVEPHLRKSLFTHHGLAVKNEHLAERTDTTAPAWIFVLLLSLTVLVFLYFRARKIKFTELLKSTMDRRVMDRLVRECNLIRSAQFVPVALLLAATVGMVVYSAAMMHNGLFVYLLVVVALATGYLLRNGLLRLLGNVFDNRDAVTAYITSNYLFHLLLTTVLLPLLFLQLYMPLGNTVVQYITFGVVALSLVVRVTRGMNIFLTISKGFNFYLFYYLCTVEIVPVLVVAKLLIE